MSVPKIAVTMGDPCGIGPEIVALSLQERKVWEACTPVVVGQKDIFNKAIEITKSRIRTTGLHDHNSMEEALANKDIRADVEKHVIFNVPFVSIGDFNIRKFKFGVPSIVCGRLAFDFVKRAVQMCKEGFMDGMATAPINKFTLKMAGINYIGHTEMLKDLTGSREAITMFQVKKLRIFFLSRHKSLRDALDEVKKEKILEMLEIADRYLRGFNIENPHIAVSALNPHAGEQGLFGIEEVKEIKPAIEEAKSLGISAEGPYPADSVFYRAANGEFDAVISLYHDQGHVASKMYDFNRTVSVTLGLPFIRTSVDHGTAYDLAGKALANPTSMKEAIIAAARYASISQY